MQTVQDTFNLAAAKGKALLAVLVDPDKSPEKGWPAFARNAAANGADMLLAGGSLLSNGHLEEVVKVLKAATELPVVIFPGHPMQITGAADGILLLSLISGRNADLLIGQHVHAAPLLKRSGLEILPTGYILVDGGRVTTVSYISNTQPIPSDKPDIAVCTAMAAEMLGLRNIYLEAGSGALYPVSPEMVAAVKAAVDLPLIVGGGIRKAADAKALVKAGADVVVVGSALEKDPELLKELAEAVHSRQ